MIGILGGTFDPVHNGHLRLAMEIMEELGVDQVRLVPANVPPHRTAPAAAAENRVEMLEAALKDVTGLIPDRRELKRDGPSFTLDTLISLRSEFPHAPLGLIVGMDAFCTLDTWHNWRQLADYAHIIVAQRPNSPEPRGEVADLLRQRRIASLEQLHERDSGHIFIHATPLLDISATRIRALIAAGANPRYLLPDSVIEIIHNRGLYLDAR
ncbi:MAG: nicotinate-nucleotide adenylyltransferase [Gammaproteobacteria bacterium]|nr:nicotinate-nucleotide adenylyltransferase [Gammaproteobacteria bacterium]